MHCYKIRSDKSKYLYKENFLNIFYKYSKSFKGGGSQKKNRFLANNVFNTNTLSTCEFYVWRIYFEWCLVASTQIFAVQKLYVERFIFQCAHLLVLGILKKILFSYKDLLA